MGMDAYVPTRHSDTVLVIPALERQRLKGQEFKASFN